MKRAGPFVVPSLIVFFLVVFPTAHARILQDTLSIKSRISTSDTTQTPHDSLRVRFIPALGSLYHRIDSTSVLHSSQFVRTDAKYVGDLVWKIPGFYLRDLGEVGKPNQLNAFGVDGRGISVLLDGRPLNDPLTGAVNLYDIPLESVEQIETVDNLDALMLGSQSSGINLVTRQYNNVRPITKIRYLQGPFEYSLTDGLFTQNIARGTNLMLGFQRHVTDGRFTNSAYDFWHVRGRLRYNYSDRFNLSLSEFYSTSTNGMNGGIDLTRSPSIFDEVTAIVQNRDAADKVCRHDVTLNGIARLFEDTTSTTQFAFYYSEIEREYNDPPQSISDRNVSSLLGARFLQNLSGHYHRTTVGFDVERARVLGSTQVGFRSEKRATLFAKTEVRALDFLRTQAFLRSEQRESASALSYGFGLKAQLGNLVELQGDYSTSFRFPTFQERFWTDSTIIRLALPETEKHKTLTLGLDFKFGPMANFSLSVYDRVTSRNISVAYLFQPQASSTILISTISEMNIRGIAGHLSFHWWKFEGVGTWAFSEIKHNDSLKTLIPKWSATGEVAYRNTVLKDVMELRTGLRFRFAARHQGMAFHPQTWMYLENSGREIGSFSTIDFFLVAKLGDAYLTLGWENILNENYMTTSVYPMPNRTLRFGVNWVFID